MRSNNAPNMCIGFKILEDMQYAWLHCYPEVQYYREDSDSFRNINGARIRKRGFSTETREQIYRSVEQKKIITS